MRREADIDSINRFIRLLGKRATGAGRIYLVGGTSAVLYGWRPSTIDIDIKLDPEPPGVFEAIALLKDELELNVELAAPDDFLPELPGWRERSPWIAKHGSVDFHHYDFYSQALSKLERGHPRDLADVANMRSSGLIDLQRLSELYNAIVPRLIRFPAIDPNSLTTVVKNFIAEENQ